MPDTRRGSDVAQEDERYSGRWPALQRALVKRIVIPSPGGYDRLFVEEVEDPRPGPGEVLVDVAAAGINYADCIARMGLYASARELRGYPLVAGFEVAGTVSHAGHADTGLAPGDQVVGITLFGGYASRVSLPTRQVFRLPESIPVEEAAGVPTVFLTAWWALHRLAAVRAGETVLVHSAAGGVGGALVQIAKLAGCRVLGIVGSPHKRVLAEALGCDTVVDKSSEKLWDAARAFAPGGFDVVLDANGYPTLRAGYDHLAPGGRLVVYGFAAMLPKSTRDGRGKPDWLRIAAGWLRTPRFSPLTMTRDNKSVLAFNLSFMEEKADELGEGMRWILGEIAAGRLRPLPVTPFSFEAVAEAHRAIESGKTTGKLVLVP
ncbi:MAG: zinc-binding dehydrogenase [Gammaproteobacteria bacterium]